MPTNLASGIKRPVGSDFNNRVSYIENLDITDFLLRPYKEKIDITTWDDSAQVYTKLQYLRPEDGSVAISCQLSNKNANGKYVTDTWTLNMPSGSKTRTWALTYDTNGNVIEKSYVDS